MLSIYNTAEILSNNLPTINFVGLAIIFGILFLALATIFVASAKTKIKLVQNAGLSAFILGLFSLGHVTIALDYAVLNGMVAII